MQIDLLSAAGLLVATELRVDWLRVECSGVMTNLVAVKPVTSLSKPLDEHERH